MTIGNVVKVKSSGELFIYVMPKTRRPYAIYLDNGWPVAEVGQNKEAEFALFGKSLTHIMIKQVAIPDWLRPGMNLSLEERTSAKQWLERILRE